MEVGPPSLYRTDRSVLRLGRRGRRDRAHRGPGDAGWRWRRMALPRSGGSRNCLLPGGRSRSRRLRAVNRTNLV